MAGEVQYVPIKISELPSVSSYVNLYTIGTDGYLRSVKVPLAILAQIGDLNNLQTSDKSSLVAAINEAAQTGSGGGSNLTGYVVEDSIADLPIPGEPTLGYLVGTNLYLYVGEGGDTRSGAYQNCGPFRGPQGPQGIQGIQGPQGIQGRDGQAGQDGADGTPAGFGTPSASVDDNVGTPNVTVEATGPDTAKIFTFTFRNLKGATGATGATGPAGQDGADGRDGQDGRDGEQGPAGPAGVTSVVLVVGSGSGTPTGSVSLNDGVLTISLDGIKGAQGNSGSSQAFPFELVNNVTEGGADKALSAEQGKFLNQKIDNKFVFLTTAEYEALSVKDSTKIYCTYEDEQS